MAALVLTVIWYAVVLLVFYRSFLVGLFSGGVPVRRGLPPVTAVNEFRKGHGDGPAIGMALADREEGLLGAAKLPEGMSLVGAGDFSFAGGDGGVDREAQVGLVPDVLQELKEVFEWLTKNDGNKRDFLQRMELLLLDYPKLSSHPAIGQLNAYVAEHAPFHLTAEELDNLWG